MKILLIHYFHPQTVRYKYTNEKGEFKTLAHIEKEAIHAALIHHNGRISLVARKLGIGRSTLYRKIDEYGIDIHEAPEAGAA